MGLEFLYFLISLLIVGFFSGLIAGLLGVGGGLVIIPVVYYILNFYGYQRFGSKRPVTHLIGKAILQRDFKKAVELILSFTSSSLNIFCDFK